MVAASFLALSAGKRTAEGLTIAIICRLCVPSPSLVLGDCEDPGAKGGRFRSRAFTVLHVQIAIRLRRVVKFKGKRAAVWRVNLLVDDC